MLVAHWLLFDADDTLWDNNVYFEIAIAQFFEMLGIRGEQLPPARKHLDDIEARNAAKQGYGAANFGRNLIECLESLGKRTATLGQRERVADLVQIVKDHQIRPYPRVQETLEDLAERNRLAVVTKGDFDEQSAKIARSGLHGYFEHVEYLPEKDAGRYKRLVADLGASPATTWMIGNSPKSDVNPALAAGIGAILVPNENTWKLEDQPIPEDHPRFRRVGRFADLSTLF